MRVLIVEDDNEIVEFLMQGLSYENFKVDVAYDGEMAIKKACEHEYDVILLNLMLPRVLKNLRENKITTSIIAVTTAQDNTTKIKLLNAGADDYIEKPFSFSELVARIKAVVRKSQSNPQEETFTIDDLELNSKRKEVKRNHRKINLRNKEFELLEYLMKNEGIVVTRNTIMERVWQYNVVANSNTVDTYIAILRKKIDNGHKRKLIHTVHGVGYKIANEK
jgi:DNA-binding response OmpR family regulator